jgi:pimeloyl-ACP methyl ester carboxylesterase
MRLRLYHHADGARVAYREAGTGPPLGLLHALGLSHREWEPVVAPLAERFRLVIPDLPLHGDSEDRPRHAYSPDWMADVLAGFCRSTLGPRPLVGGHALGAELLLRAIARDELAPARLVLMSSRLHARARRPARLQAGRATLRLAALPGLDRLLSHAAAALVRPTLADRLSVHADPAARDLLRHALMDLGGNSSRARSWARFARSWSPDAQPALARAYDALADVPVLLLWADRDPGHPLAVAEEALARLPRGQLRVLAHTGFLMAYDDPVGLARELSAFCG